LGDVLACTADIPQARVDELLPWNWKLIPTKLAA
jgi:hypothetical protein